MAFSIDKYTDPSRIIIYVNVTDIEGDPLKRPIRLGSDFCREVLSRTFNSQVNPEGYDAVHIPGGFDSNKKLWRYFAFDLGVEGPKSKPELACVPHYVFCASRQENEWKFIYRPSSTDQAVKRTLSYTWGGETEQELFAQMKTDSILQ